MNALSKLKLVASKPVRAANPAQIRRNKLLSKIAEQIELASAQREGRTYVAKRVKTVVDADTGLRTAVETTKRVKEWYWVNEAGKVNLALRYGAKILELAKGKSAIEVADGEELLATLQLLKNAVVAGELDSQLESASKAVKAAFNQ